MQEFVILSIWDHDLILVAKDDTTNFKNNRSQCSQRNLPVPGVRGTILFRTNLHSITSLVLSIRK